MKTPYRLLALGLIALMHTLVGSTLRADETITVTATSADISENLDLKTVAMLFGEAKDLEEFESMLNNPDSAYSNLDLNGDGQVDYLRVVETADANRHLVVIQAVLAKDIYQDVASIFLEKEEKSQTVTIQVVGDEYVYGADYIIEPVYIYRPIIYDWFWGPSWVCWHSPYYWGYYPHYWRPYYCVDPFIYWDHCYWHHYHRPICSYRTAHHIHRHHHHMHQAVRRNDYGHAYPERSFATRNASHNIKNARSFEQTRRTAVRDAHTSQTGQSRVSASGTTTSRQVGTADRTHGSTNVRTTGTTSRSAGTTTATRSASTTTRVTGTTTTTRSTGTSSTVRSSGTTTRSTGTSSTVRSSGTTTRSAGTSSTVRSSGTTTRSAGTSSTVRSSGTTTRSAGTSSTVRSSGGSVSRSSAGGSVRSSGGSVSRSSGGSTRR